MYTGLVLFFFTEMAWLDFFLERIKSVMYIIVMVPCPWYDEMDRFLVLVIIW